MIEQYNFFRDSRSNIGTLDDLELPTVANPFFTVLEPMLPKTQISLGRVLFPHIQPSSGYRKLNRWRHYCDRIIFSRVYVQLHKLGYKVDFAYLPETSLGIQSRAHKGWWFAVQVYPKELIELIHDEYL